MSMLQNNLNVAVRSDDRRQKTNELIFLFFDY